MMQIRFILPLIIWDIFFPSGNTKNIQQYSLGCEAVIPCQLYKGGESTSEWFYAKQEGSDTVQISYQIEGGRMMYSELFRTKIRVKEKNWSLVINSVTEDYQGLYWCEVCTGVECQKQDPTVIQIKKDVLKEIQKTFFIPAGGSFNHTCPEQLTVLKWTFKASKVTADRNLEQKHQPYFLTHSKSVQIFNVSTENAGEYTCWTGECKRHWQKILTINVCVITVNCSKDSTVSCAVVCDGTSNTNPNSTLKVERGTSVVVAPNGSLNCSDMQISDLNCTNKSTNPFNSTAGTELIPVIYGTTITFTCLLLMALLICLLKPRLQKEFHIQLCCCGLNGRAEAEATLVYSSIIIRRSSDTRDILSNDDCVYSEINAFHNNVPS